jgi:hypothetical protein
MLIDGDGTVMSCPILPTGARLADQDLVRLVTSRRPAGGKPPATATAARPCPSSGSPLPVTSRVTNERPAGHGTFAWQSSDELFAPTRHLFA